MKLDLNAKLYRGTAGTTATSEIKNITNESINFTTDESDATTRGSDGWKSIIATLKDASLEFTLLDDEAVGSKENIDAFWTAFFAGTPLSIKSVDKSDGRGVDADWTITAMSSDRELTKVTAYKVTAKPNTTLRSPLPIN